MSSTRISKMPSLNAHVYVANKEGLKEILTVREVIAQGRGKAYDALKAMGSWEDNIAQFKAEKKNPLAAAKNAVRLATKVYEKAQWWLDVGLYRMAREAARKVTREEETEAIDELRAADIQLTNRVQDENAILEKIDTVKREGAWNEFNETALEDSGDSDIKLGRVGKLGASLPIYPWTDYTTNYSVTTNFFSTCVPQGSSPIYYPPGTELVCYPMDTMIVVSYTVQEDKDIHARTAFITAAGEVAQVSPVYIIFPSVGKFIDYMPRMLRAKVTVTLPPAVLVRQA